MATTTKRRSKNRSGNGNLAIIGAVASMVVLVGAVVGIMATSGGQTTTSPVGGSASEAAPATTTTGLTPTGETSEMGFPVVETPGYASGSASAGGVSVQGADWAMGQVPLNVAVRPFWTLTNTGAKPVTLGEPQAEVRAGCCPGPFVMERSELAPGESTTLTFELGMSAGMDGWHDMGVYVPVQGSGGSEVLALSVTGDFRN